MNPEQLFTQMKESNKPVIIELTANWCVPCRVMRPTLEKVASAFQAQVNFLKIDADENPEVVQALGVMGIPALIGFRDGNEVVRRVGSQSESGLVAMFEEVASGKKSRAAVSAYERVLRLAAGSALLGLGWFANRSPFLLIAGAIILFSAVYDRCPLWQALAPRLGQLFRNLTSSR